MLEGEAAWMQEGRWEEEEEEHDMWPRMSVIVERGFNEIYVYEYICSWAQVVFIRIPWHFLEKQKL